MSSWRQWLPHGSRGRNGLQVLRGPDGIPRLSQGASIMGNTFFKEEKVIYMKSPNLCSEDANVRCSALLKTPKLSIRIERRCLLV